MRGNRRTICSSLPGVKWNYFHFNAEVSYLDYLDEEMTIMGILSSFRVAAAALIFEVVGDAGSTKHYFFGHMSGQHMSALSIGSGFLIAAGVCFNLQRSKLTHIYGSICIAHARPGPELRDEFNEIVWYARGLAKLDGIIHRGLLRD